MFYNADVAKLVKRSRLKICHIRNTAGSNPAIRTKFKGPLAHAWLEQRTHNSLVRGSTPRGPTRFNRGLEKRYLRSLISFSCWFNSSTRYHFPASRPKSKNHTQNRIATVNVIIRIIPQKVFSINLFLRIA